MASSYDPSSRPSSTFASSTYSAARSEGQSERGSTELDTSVGVVVTDAVRVRHTSAIALRSDAPPTVTWAHRAPYWTTTSAGPSTSTPTPTPAPAPAPASTDSLSFPLPPSHLPPSPGTTVDEARRAAQPRLHLVASGENRDTAPGRRPPPSLHLPPTPTSSVVARTDSDIVPRHPSRPLLHQTGSFADVYTGFVPLTPVHGSFGTVSAPHHDDYGDGDDDDDDVGAIASRRGMALEASPACDGNSSSSPLSLHFTLPRPPSRASSRGGPRSGPPSPFLPSPVHTAFPWPAEEPDSSASVSVAVTDTEGIAEMYAQHATPSDEDGGRGRGDGSDVGRRRVDLIWEEKDDDDHDDAGDQGYDHDEARLLHRRAVRPEYAAAARRGGRTASRAPSSSAAAAAPSNDSKRNSTASRSSRSTKSSRKTRSSNGGGLFFSGRSSPFPFVFGWGVAAKDLPPLPVGVSGRTSVGTTFSGRTGTGTRSVRSSRSRSRIGVLRGPWNDVMRRRLAIDPRVEEEERRMALPDLIFRADRLAVKLESQADPHPPGGGPRPPPGSLYSAYPSSEALPADPLLLPSHPPWLPDWMKGARQSMQSLAIASLTELGLFGGGGGTSFHNDSGSSGSDGGGRGGGRAVGTTRKAGAAAIEAYRTYARTSPRPQATFFAHHVRTHISASDPAPPFPPLYDAGNSGVEGGGGAALASHWSKGSSAEDLASSFNELDEKTVWLPSHGHYHGQGRGHGEGEDAVAPDVVVVVDRRRHKRQSYGRHDSHGHGYGYGYGDEDDDDGDAVGVASGATPRPGVAWVDLTERALPDLPPSRARGEDADADVGVGGVGGVDVRARRRGARKSTFGAAAEEGRRRRLRWVGGIVALLVVLLLSLIIGLSIGLSETLQSNPRHGS